MKAQHVFDSKHAKEEWRLVLMHYPDVNNEITVPHQYSPGSTPPRTSSKRHGGLPTGAVIALTLLLAVVFGTGLFAGWQLGIPWGSHRP
jgi:hypothetical protein